MEYCHKHDRRYDSDYEVECQHCVQEELEEIIGMKMKKKNKKHWMNSRIKNEKTN